MKNIYNLVTDLFIAMNEDETKYTTDIQFIDIPIPNYVVKISRIPLQESAGITLILDDALELIDYHEYNTLFTRWAEVYFILESQISR
jgi:hypothetical protein